MIPAPAPMPIPAAAPGVIADDEDDGAEDVFELGEEVGVTSGLEYVAEPVTGRSRTDMSSAGPGAGKTSSVVLEQSGCPPL